MTETHMVISEILLLMPSNCISSKPLTIGTDNTPGNNCRFPLLMTAASLDLRALGLWGLVSPQGRCNPLRASEQ